MKNIDIVKTILSVLGKSDELITYVEDRKGHDLRYAVDPSKIEHELDWKPEKDFSEGIKETVKWYLDNRKWWEDILSGEYKNFKVN